MPVIGEVDATAIPERSGLEPVPAGKYSVMVTESDVKPTKDGTGEMLVLTLEIQDEDFKGRKLFERLNIKNKNEQAVQIAFQTLGEIIRACNKQKISNSDELHNIRMTAEVTVQPARNYKDSDGVEREGKPQNTIRRYLPYAASAPAAAGAAAGGAPAARPWAKK